MLSSLRKKYCLYEADNTNFLMNMDSKLTSQWRCSSICIILIAEVIPIIYSGSIVSMKVWHLHFYEVLLCNLIVDGWSLKSPSLSLMPYVPGRPLYHSKVIN